jgi:hypothetical protein
MSDDGVVESLKSAVGQPVRRVRRIHYTFDGVADTDFGPVELTVGKRVFLIDNASDGDSLRVLAEEWHDPFAEPMSPENREFVAKSGKWTAYDVSGDPEFAAFTGDLLQSVEPFSNSDGKVTGVALRTAGGGTVRLDVIADELYLNRAG